MPIGHVFGRTNGGLEGLHFSKKLRRQGRKEGWRMECVPPVYKQGRKEEEGNDDSTIHPPFHPSLSSKIKHKHAKHS
jgi:hypothetical protein